MNISKVFLTVALLAPNLSSAESSEKNIPSVIEDIVAHDEIVRADAVAVATSLKKLAVRITALTTFLESSKSLFPDRNVDQETAELTQAMTDYNQLYDNTKSKILYGTEEVYSSNRLVTTTGKVLSQTETVDIFNFIYTDCRARIENGTIVVNGPKSLDSAYKENVEIEWPVFEAVIYSKQQSISSSGRFSSTIIPRTYQVEFQENPVRNYVYGMSAVTLTIDDNSDPVAPSSIFTAFLGTRVNVGWALWENGREQSIHCQKNQKVGNIWTSSN